MMFPNKLYRFIKITVSQTTNSTANGEFKFLKNNDQQSYVLYELKHVKSILMDDVNVQSYKLTSHHISVYEFQDKSKPHLSQYHYTAYFENRQDQQFRLHVYFDQNDQLTTAPVFAELQGNNEYISQSTTAVFAEMLYEFAMAHCAHFMGEMRTQFSADLNRLKQAYNKTEQFLAELSQDLQRNRASYLISLKQAISCLDKLSVLQDDLHYKATARFLKRLEQSMLLTPQELPKLLPSAEEKEQETNNSAQMPVGSQSLADTEKLWRQKEIANLCQLLVSQHHFDENLEFVKDLLRFKKPENLESLSSDQLEQTCLSLVRQAKQLIIEIEKYYSSTPKISFKTQLDIFNILNQLAQDLYRFIDSSKLTFPLSEVQHIQFLQCKVYEHGKKLLATLLIGNQFDLADKLIGFAKSLPDSLFKMALVKGDARLLDYLLTQGDFAINTYIVKDNLTPVLFCFYHHSATSSKVDCLSVLIKHKASIMVAARDGLPVAYHISQQESHPLYKALLANDKDYLGRPEFYKTLICYLNNHLKIAEINRILIDDMTRRNIEQYIQACKSRISKVSSRFSRIEGNAVGMTENLTVSALENIPASIPFLETMKMDADLQLLNKELSFYFTEWSKKLSGDQQYKLRVQKNKFEVGLQQLTKDFQTTEFAQSKPTIKSALQTQIDCLKLLIEIADVQATTKSANAGKKAIKQAKSKSIQLFSALKQKQQEFENLVLPPQPVGLLNRQYLRESSSIMAQLSEFMREHDAAEQEIVNSNLPEEEKQKKISDAMLKWVTKTSEGYNSLNELSRRNMSPADWAAVEREYEVCTEALSPPAPGK